MLGLASIATSSTRGSDSDLRSAMPIYVRVGTCLVQLLKVKINANSHPHIFQNYANGASIIDTLKGQFELYTHQAYPFHIKEKSPCKYWTKILDYPNASILAVSFSGPELY